jgi:hypothetical protein
MTWGISFQQLIDCDTQNHGCAGGDPYTAFAYAMDYKLPYYE